MARCRGSYCVVDTENYPSHGLEDYVQFYNREQRREQSKESLEPCEGQPAGANGWFGAPKPCAVYQLDFH